MPFINISRSLIWSVKAGRSRSRIAIRHTGSHSLQIGFLVHTAPINALPQVFLKHQVKPNTGATTIPLAEGVCHIHFHVFIHYLVECIFRHTLDGLQRSRQIMCHSKLKSAFSDIYGTYLTRKIIQTSKDIGMYLLQPAKKSPPQYYLSRHSQKGCRLFSCSARQWKCRYM